MGNRKKRVLKETARMLISAVAFVPVIGEAVANGRDFYDELKSLALDEVEYGRILDGISNIPKPKNLNKDDAFRIEAAIIRLLENENMEIENGYLTEDGIAKLKANLQEAVFEDKVVDSSVIDYISSVIEFIGLPFVRRYLINSEDLGIVLQDKVLQLDGRVENLENTKQQSQFITKTPQSDNEDYLKHFNEPLFLEEDDDSKVTLASMYVSPQLEGKEISVADCIMQWSRKNTKNTCMLLYGNAGIGKSSLVSKIIADANSSVQVKEFQFTPDQVLAVALRNYYDSIDLQERAERILANLFSVHSPDELKNKLLILDGLDEICVLNLQFDGLLFLKKMASLRTGFHVLVTSREANNYFQNPSKLGIVGLTINRLKWTKKELELWCNKYQLAKTEKCKWHDQFIREYKRLNKKDRRIDVFCVPMILYICGDSEISLSNHNSVGSIYGDAFRLILLRKYIDGHDDHLNLSEADKKHNLIAWQYTKELAYQMFLLKIPDLIGSDEIDNQYSKGFQNAQNRTKEIMKTKYGLDVNDNDLEIKKELALCPFTKENGKEGITFVHKTVYEYFTAVKIYEDYFSKFSSDYFTEHNKNDEVRKQSRFEILESFVEAFRYAVIPSDIFDYLIDMNRPAFASDNIDILLMRRYIFPSLSVGIAQSAENENPDFTPFS